MAQNTWTRRRREKRKREEQDRHEERREQRRASLMEQGHVLGLEEAEEQSDQALHRTVRSGSRRGVEGGEGAAGLVEALVVHYRRNHYELRLADGRTVAGASRSTTRTPHHDATLIAVGDRVLVNVAEGVIAEVLARRNRISRASKIHREVEQVLVANVDQILVVASVQDPYLKPGLIDRYLLSAERFGIQALVCLNKIDLAPPEAWEDVAVAYREAGLRVLACSATDGRGLDDLREALRGRVSVLSGQSGVGKSSLLNALDPDLRLPVGEVMRQARKGRHTTTHSRLIPFRFGGYVADTPGIKEFTLWRMTPQEVAALYPELREWAAKCRFNDCTHTHEPDCAVLEAVDAGRVNPLRFRTYLQIVESLLEEGG
ncbi:MAG: ribosome small subunit-dependent GTPase A [bacterium]|nr:ribosome small subunit-dependent GTPase A [bacterium]